MQSVTNIILDKLDDEGILTDYLLASNIIDSTPANYRGEPLPNYPVTTTDLPEHIQTYLKNRQFDGLSKGALRIYFYTLQELTYFMNKPAKNISINDLRDFLHYPKFTKNVREGLSVIDIEVCREACNADRQRAVFEFLLASGSRISEAKNLLYKDVITGEFQVIGKGSEVRYCYLNEKCLMYLNRYHDNRKGDSPYLFTQLRYPCKQVSTRALQDEITSSGKKCNIHLYPHRLRHTFASTALENGASLTSVQKILGHSKLSTTQVYAKLPQASVKNEYQRYFNISTPKSSFKLI